MCGECLAHEECVVGRGPGGGAAGAQDFGEQPAVVGRKALGVQPPRPAGCSQHLPLLPRPAPDLVRVGTVDTLEQAGRRWVTAVCGTASPSGGLQARKGQDPNARLSALPEEAARLLSLRWVAWASGEAAGAYEYVCVHE